MGNGYVKLWRSLNQNEILANDNNAYIVFTRLLLLVDRKTGAYTTGRKKLAAYMNMNDRTLYGVLKRLQSATMLQLESNSYATTIHLCNWSKWQQDGNTSATEAQTQRNTKQEEEREEDIDTKVSNIKAIEKPNKKNPDIDLAFEYWKQITGIPIQGQQQKNRYAAKNLIAKHGLDGVKQLVEGVKFAQETPYAPKIADFIELQAKLNKLITWGHGAKKQSESKVVKI